MVNVDYEIVDQVFESLIIEQQRCSWYQLFDVYTVDNIEDFKLQLRTTELQRIVVTSCRVMGMRIQWFRDYYIFKKDLKNRGIEEFNQIPTNVQIV